MRMRGEEKGIHWRKMLNAAGAAEKIAYAVRTNCTAPGNHFRLSFSFSNAVLYFFWSSGATACPTAADAFSSFSSFFLPPKQLYYYLQPVTIPSLLPGHPKGARETIEERPLKLDRFSGFRLDEVKSSSFARLFNAMMPAGRASTDSV